ncbi:MAG: hypothetical protein KGJ07_04645, partial [Patescibacteria group bacterium]|nr:hypothetical protein [Patescibacteria group bacterium]
MRNFPGRELGSRVFGLGITNGFGFRGRSREKAQLFSADTTGIQRRVPLVAQTIAKKDVKERIVTAMVGSGQFPRDTATHIIDGEQGRILGLGKAYWPFFYGLPLSLLDKSHHHVKSIFEKGPSLDAHLGVLDRRLQPKRSEAVDFSHIARGATEFIDIMQRQGLLRRLGKYHVRTEQEIPQSYHADLSISILEAQYDKPFDLARQLFQHSDTVLVGDVLHGRISLPLAAPVTIGDKVKFTTVTQPGKPTGFQLELLGEAGIHED